MKSLTPPLLGFLAGFAIAMTSFQSQALGPFSEDFESGLGQWTGRGGGAHTGLTVPDPLASGHGNVLTFASFATGGDTFVSNPILLSGPITLGFDYLGLPALGGTPGDLGGFLGAVYSLMATNEGTDLFWYAGTQDTYPGLLVSLVDDGAWHHYSLQLNASAMPPFHLMLEDFIGSGGVPQDAFFDNITVTQVPEPTVAGIAGLILLLGALGRAPRRN